MKTLTIRQPWASLIAAGVKTIETRTRPTRYRGGLAIHAAKADTDATIVPGHPAMPAWDALGECIGGVVPPRGAVVAVADLVDCVPIMRRIPPQDEWQDPWQVLTTEPWPIVTGWSGFGSAEAISVHHDQRPFGDFTPGRWAWLLNDVRPLANPVPMKGHQGMRDVPEDIATQIKAQLS